VCTGSALGHKLISRGYYFEMRSSSGRPHIARARIEKDIKLLAETDKTEQAKCLNRAKLFMPQ